MKTGRDYKFWFCTGSQDLYGDECLRKVAEHSKIIVEELNKSGVLPFEVVWKPTLITNELIRKTFNDANADENCAGVIAWMHTFSPAKSWILGPENMVKLLLYESYKLFHNQSALRTAWRANCWKTSSIVSAPNCCFRRAGVSRALICPSTIMEIRLQYSASSI